MIGQCDWFSVLLLERERRQAVRLKFGTIRGIRFQIEFFIKNDREHRAFSEKAESSEHSFGNNFPWNGHELDDVLGKGINRARHGGREGNEKDVVVERVGCV